jgi:predicted O-methyltransferase YrrM
MAQKRKQVQQLADLGFSPLGAGPIDDARPIVSGGHAAAFGDVVDLTSPRFVIEVGSWEGRSAVLWGNALAQTSDGWALACIDTWLGSVEHRQIKTGEWGIERLYLEDHYPSLFRTFASNIRRAGMADNVIPLPIDSPQGLEMLAVSKIYADLIYVDAAHDYTAARADIEMALTLRDETNPNALVLCDDFNSNWPGVQEAVRACAAASSARLVIRDGQAAILSKRANAIADALVARGWTEEKVSSAGVPSGGSAAERDVIQRLTADLRVEQNRAHEALVELHRANSAVLQELHRAHEALVELGAFRSTFSWRITAPLRVIRGALRRR